MKRLLVSATLMIAMAGPVLAAAPGDVVGAPTFGPYLLNNRSARLVFPDDVTVQTWGNPDITQVDVSALSQWALAGVIPIRQGSKLVKFGTDPQVYAIGPNATLHWIESEALANALYGQDWNHRVATLFTSYFPNYTVGEPITSAKHPDGTLLRYEGDPTVYFIINGQARAFADEASFRANRFDDRSVVTVPHNFVYTQGSKITGWEQDLNLSQLSL